MHQDLKVDRGLRARMKAIRIHEYGGVGPLKPESSKRQFVMKQTWHGHSAFRIEAGEAKILIDPFLSDNPSRDNGWSGYLTGKNPT